MPYIAVKMWPKTKEQKKALAENLVRTVADTLGCPKQFVTLSIEEFEPETWDAAVGPEMSAKRDQMYVIQGEKTEAFDE